MMMMTWCSNNLNAGIINRYAEPSRCVSRSNSHANFASFCARSLFTRWSANKKQLHFRHSQATFVHANFYGVPYAKSMSTNHKSDNVDTIKTRSKNNAVKKCAAFVWKSQVTMMNCMEARKKTAQCYMNTMWQREFAGKLVLRLVTLNAVCGSDDTHVYL